MELEPLEQKSELVRSPLSSVVQCESLPEAGGTLASPPNASAESSPPASLRVTPARLRRGEGPQVVAGRGRSGAGSRLRPKHLRLGCRATSVPEAHAD